MLPLVMVISSNQGGQVNECTSPPPFTPPLPLPEYGYQGKRKSGAKRREGRIAISMTVLLAT